MEDSPGTEQFLKMIKEIRNEVEEALKKTNVVMKERWDTKKKPEVEWKNGELVLGNQANAMIWWKLLEYFISI